MDLLIEKTGILRGEWKKLKIFWYNSHDFQAVKNNAQLFDLIFLLMFVLDIGEHKCFRTVLRRTWKGLLSRQLIPKIHFLQIVQMNCWHRKWEPYHKNAKHLYGNGCGIFKWQRQKDIYWAICFKMTKQEFNRLLSHKYDANIMENTERFGQEDQSDDDCFTVEMESS